VEIENKEAQMFISERNSKIKKDILAPYIFILPAVFLVIVLAVIPILYSLYISFHSYRLGMPSQTIHFNGWANYQNMLTNKLFLDSISWTFVFTCITVSFNLILGMSLASILNNSLLAKKLKIFRSFFILPIMLAPVVSATVWQILFAPIYGPINFFLNKLGIPYISWIGSEVPAKLAISVIDIWGSTPFCMLIFLAAFQTIPVELYEAARIDGASRFKVFTAITLPLMRNFIALVVSIRVMDALRVFDSVMILTKGGPGTSTETMGTVIYKTAFRYVDLGSGSAGAFIFFVIIIIVTLISLKLIRQKS
jgi:multiple sugar transport system permease protein